MVKHVVRNAEEVECECGCGDFFHKEECLRYETPEGEDLIISRVCFEEVYGRELLKEAKPLT